MTNGIYLRNEEYFNSRKKSVYSTPAINRTRGKNHMTIADTEKELDKIQYSFMITKKKPHSAN